MILNLIIYIYIFKSQQTPLHPSSPAAPRRAPQGHLPCTTVSLFWSNSRLPPTLWGQRKDHMYRVSNWEPGWNPIRFSHFFWHTPNTGLKYYNDYIVGISFSFSFCWFNRPIIQKGLFWLLLQKWRFCMIQCWTHITF
jgi:hypothetical protein